MRIAEGLSWPLDRIAAYASCRREVDECPHGEASTLAYPERTSFAVIAAKVVAIE